MTVCQLRRHRMLKMMLVHQKWHETIQQWQNPVVQRLTKRFYRQGLDGVDRNELLDDNLPQNGAILKFQKEKMLSIDNPALMLTNLEKECQVLVNMSFNQPYHLNNLDIHGANSNDVVTTDASEATIKTDKLNCGHL